jgi:hypothetical protein
MTVPIAFLRKLAADEILDTMFFATGHRAEKDKTHKDYWVLKNEVLEVKIYNNRKIIVNNDKCRSIPEAKWVIQDIIYDI